MRGRLYNPSRVPMIFGDHVHIGPVVIDVYLCLVHLPRTNVIYIVQGIMLVKHQSVHAPEVMVRLWMHEMARVFGDRLGDPPQRVVFEHMLIESIGR